MGFFDYFEPRSTQQVPKEVSEQNELDLEDDISFCYEPDSGEPEEVIDRTQSSADKYLRKRGLGIADSYLTELPKDTLQLLLKGKMVALHLKDRSIVQFVSMQKEQE